jgi:inosose dehydratase
MTIQIGNAPCSWGVEFPNDPRNPAWRTVLAQCAEAGYTGIELGPVGFMPEDPPRSSPRRLTSTGWS